MNFDPDALNRQAVALQSQGQCRQSLALFRQAAEAFRARGDRRGEGRCLNGVGALYKDLGETQLAERYLEQALLLRRSTGDEAGEAITLTTLGPVYQRLGKPGQAHTVLLSALETTRRLGIRDREGQALFNLGELAAQTGRVESAHDFFRSALSIGQESADIVEIIKCFIALGTTSGELGNKSEAISYSLQGLRMSEQVGSIRGQSAALHCLGALLQHTDREDEALECFQRSVAIDLATGAPAEAGKTMVMMAAALFDSNPSEAEVLANRAVAVARGTGDQSTTAVALQVLSELLVERGHWQGALSLLEEARQLGDRTSEPLSEAQALFVRGRALSLKGDVDSAIAAFEGTLEIVENVFVGLTSDNRLSYFNQWWVQHVYLVYSACLAQYAIARRDSQLAAKGFHVCEQRHARVLREQLQRHTPLSPPPFARTNAPTVNEVQQQLLDTDTALLEFSLHRGTAYVWLVTSDEHMVTELSMGGEQIREQVKALRQAVIDGSDTFRQRAYDLYRVLVGPVEHGLQRKRNLLLIPDEVLHLLPFQLLLTESPGVTDDSNLPYLVHRHRIAYAPSAGIFAALRNASSKRRSPRFIAFAPVHFGSPPDQGKSLPGTLAEVDAIARLFRAPDAVVHRFGEATKHAVLSAQLKDFDYIHFATHGHGDHGDPDGAFIVLHGSGGEHCLRPSEIAKLELNGALVVLSACETAVGKVTIGDGVLGLVRAFVCAGAAAVCASLWKVADAATARLMVALYERLQNGASNAEALHMAQLDLISDPAFSAPHLWGAFVLAGLGRPPRAT